MDVAAVGRGRLVRSDILSRPCAATPEVARRSAPIPTNQRTRFIHPPHERGWLELRATIRSRQRMVARNAPGSLLSSDEAAPSTGCDPRVRGGRADGKL